MSFSGAIDSYEPLCRSGFLRSLVELEVAIALFFEEFDALQSARSLILS